MMEKQTRFIPIPLIAGLVGGVLAVRLFPPRVEAAEPNTVRATRFELVDKAGKVKAFLGYDGTESVIAFLNRDGKIRTKLGMSPDLGYQMLTFLGADGRSRVSITTDTDGKPALNMGDENSESRVLLGFVPNDAPSPKDDAWGLVFRQPGKFSDWAHIGTLRDATSGKIHASISISREDGRIIWSAPK